VSESENKDWLDDIDMDDFDIFGISEDKGIEEDIGIVKEKENLENLFIDLFLSYSFTNTIYGKLLFHAILGQLFKNSYIILGNRRLDLRTHFFYCADSGSGKTTPLGFVRMVCNSLVLNENNETKFLIPFHIQRGEISEAGLIGGFNEVKRIGSGGRIEIFNEFVPGILYEFANDGLIIFDEAEFILKSEEKEYTKNILGYLQTAMDVPPGNQITKIMKGGKIIFNPTTSFGFLTYPTPFRIYKVLQGGFFQRLIPFFRRLTPTEWQNLQDEVKKGLCEEKWMESLTSSYKFSTLVNELLEITKKIRAEKPQIMVSSGAKDVIENFYKYFSEKFEFEGSKGQLFSTFRIRSVVQGSILASHYAILDGRRKIMAEDMEKGMDIIKRSLESLLNFIEESEVAGEKKEAWEVYWEKLKKDWFYVIRKLPIDNYGFCPLQSFAEFLSGYLGLSVQSCYRLIDIFAKKKLISKEGKMVKLK
jgi:hypothetical protein